MEYQVKSLIIQEQLTIEEKYLQRMEPLKRHHADEEHNHRTTRLNDDKAWLTPIVTL